MVFQSAGGSCYLCTVFDPVKDPFGIVGNERHLHLLFRQFGKIRYDYHEVSFIFALKIGSKCTIVKETLEQLLRSS